VASIKREPKPFDAGCETGGPPVSRQTSLDTVKSLQELADEAFRDLLKKYHRPVTLKDALRQSVRMQPANEQPKATVHRLRQRG
jgi:hypothetical protein